MTTILTDEDIETAYREIWRDLPSDFGHTSAEWIEAGMRKAESLILSRLGGGEAVAWQARTYGGPWTPISEEMAKSLANLPGFEFRPLYTSPQPATPAASGSSILIAPSGTPRDQVLHVQIEGALYRFVPESATAAPSAMPGDAEMRENVARAALSTREAASEPGETAIPPVPHHPEPHTYYWTDLEVRAIRAHGEACYVAGQRKEYQRRAVEAATMGGEGR